MKKMSLEQLNSLLARALHQLGDEGLTIVRADEAMRPWLPESYWREQQVQAEAVLDRKQARATEDRYLAENASVADLLEEGIPSLWEGRPAGMSGWGWGRTPMARSGGCLSAPTPGGQQVTFPFECYQCSRPITRGGKDHAGRISCDHATLDPAESGHRNHQPKPWHGEEEDDDEDDE